MDLKWFESKVGNKYLNESAGLAAEEEAASRAGRKTEVGKQQFKHAMFHHCLVELMNKCSQIVVSNKLKDSSIHLATLASSEKGIDEKKGEVAEEEEEDEIFESEFRQYKRTYYMTKMGVDVVSE